MGAVVSLHPAVTVSERFTHLETYDRLGRHELILARSEIGGGPALSVLLLLNEPDGDGFEILSSVREEPGVREALAIVARAVSLAALHLLPDDPL
jgi:hypothetical protein